MMHFLTMRKWWEIIQYYKKDKNQATAWREYLEHMRSKLVGHGDINTMEPENPRLIYSEL